MEGQTHQGRGGSVNAVRFEALLDKLVAIQMDLEPVCSVPAERLPDILAPDVLAATCDILHSAIADLRNIICQVNGMIALPEAATA
jgi:hypothetical protein